MQDFMDQSSCSGKALAWLWVIEYIATLPQIKPSILCDLFEAAPELPDDMGENMREMVALRCLEELFGLSCRTVNDVPSTKPKVTFDLSKSCEDVLQSILRETSLSDLKRAGPELLKCDIHPFIVHKRACMPKCALEKVKDAILEGTHPYDSLKEHSGLVDAIDRSSRNYSDHGNFGALIVRIDGSITDRQFMAPEEDLDPLLLGYNNRVVEEDSLNRNSHFDMDRGGLAHENQDGDHEKQGCIDDGHDLHSQGQGLNRDVLSDDQSLERISTSPPQCKDLVEDSFEVVRDSENEECHMEGESSLGGSEESRSGENGHDECVAPERHGQGHDTDDAFQHNKPEIADNAHKMPQVICGDELHENSPLDEANGMKPRISNGLPSVGTVDKLFLNANKDNFSHCDSNGFCRNIDVDETEGHADHISEDESDKSDGHELERDDVGLKKSQFLSSQNTLHHNSLALSDWTEQNVCIKCNNDGDLLVCSAGGCPLAVHENCLGSTVQFDNRGDFYCPFCAYSFSISEYLEAKRKAFLARKELNAFIQMGLQYQSSEHMQRAHRKRQNSSRHNKGNDLVSEFIDNENLVGREHNQATNHGQIFDVSDHQFQKSKGKEKQVEPLASCIDVNSPGREEEPDVNVRTNHISSVTEKGEEMDRYNSSGKELDRHQHQDCVDPKYHHDNHSCKDTEILCESKSKGERIQYGSFATNTDGGEESDDENDESISNYTIRFRKRKIRYAYPGTPQLRRKKVPWTPQEEQMLKEGVQKFSRNRKIPWKDILEYGSSIFLNCRTTIDLKDKWRNICKGSPKPK